MRHFLTVDVESAGRASGHCGAPDTALAPALADLLKLLEGVRARAVFFVLAQEMSAIASVLCLALKAGHEIGVHGLAHKRVDELGAVAFREDIREAKRRIEDALRHPCVSYRAPWFSAPALQKADWFFEALAMEGFSKDFSLRLPPARAASFQPRIASIREHPVPLVRFGAYKIAVLGGTALRVLPKPMIRSLMRRVIKAGAPACVYLHPYEWYPAQAAGKGARRRIALARTLPRLEWLLQTWAFSALRIDGSNQKEFPPPSPGRLPAASAAQAEGSPAASVSVTADRV